MFLYLLAASALADPSEALTERATGTFTSVDAPSVLGGRREAAIERTLEPMNFALALLARGRLEDSLAICQSYTAALTDSTFTFTCDAKPTVSTVLGGPAAPHTTETGKVYQVTSALEGDSVVVNFAGDSGGQSTRFDFSGEILVVTKVVTSDMLEVPLSCTFNYR